MKVKIKRLDKSVNLPTYATPGSVAFDLTANEDIVVASKEIKLIHTGLIVCTPPGYMLMIAARSSTPIKRGLMLANGVGIIDQDYCGPADERLMEVYNFTDKPVEVKKGDRLAQAMFVRVDKAEWEEVEDTENKTRGGVGSTG